ncbi:ATP-grasp domain-containing protein [Pseudoalteromonas aurantia]|uniref:ATP-grasp domain-containing protein n=1 Tax=Pseudoalteromonas aurantia TaxID=43654 RepID=UPI001787E80B|nr:ATP-grasp domain-containing protein [Pseudoalteromonas aurantia]
MEALLFLGKELEASCFNLLVDKYEILHILTANNTPVVAHPRVRLYRFDDYFNNGEVELEALEIISSNSDISILGIAEGDVLRVSACKEALSDPHVTVADTMLFRNKLMMKRAVAQSGFHVPEFAPVSQPFDIIKFIEKHGYPVVLKPVSGSGGTNTFVIKSKAQLRGVLNAKLFNYKELSESFMIETFVAGDMYHIDGIVNNNKVELLYVSRYRASCLSYHYGNSLSGHTLDDSHPLYERLKNATNVLVDVFPFQGITPFHLELFETPDDDIVFCEMACRVGGGPIMETLEVATGNRLDELAFKGQIVPEFRDSLRRCGSNMRCAAGWVVVPPQAGLLSVFPNELPFEWVERYYPNAEVGQTYSKANNDSDHIMRFIITGKDYVEVSERLDEVEQWLDQNVVWQFQQVQNF